MSAYRSAWTVSWFAILAVGGFWAGMTMPATAAMGAFAVGVGSAYGVGIAFLDDDLPTRTQLRGLVEPATWAGATAVSASVLSIWPCTRSLPGPTAVRITSSPECTSALARAGRLPSRNTAPGTFL